MGEGHMRLVRIKRQGEEWVTNHGRSFLHRREERSPVMQFPRIFLKCTIEMKQLNILFNFPSRDDEH